MIEIALAKKASSHHLKPFHCLGFLRLYFPPALQKVSTWYASFAELVFPRCFAAIFLGSGSGRGPMHHFWQAVQHCQCGDHRLLFIPTLLSGCTALSECFTLMTLPMNEAVRRRQRSHQLGLPRLCAHFDDVCSPGFLAPFCRSLSRSG